MRLTVSVLLCIFVPFLMRGQAPVADFAVSTVTGCAPLVVNFTDKSTGSPLSWNWNFGSQGLSTAQNPSIAFPAGTYSVTLVVRNASGINSITKTDIIVSNPSPSVRFSADKTIACIPAVIQFTDATVANAGTITDWKWDFGDPPQSTDQNPQHTYTSPGYYNINLQVTSSTGCKGSGAISRYIRVVNGVTADFSYSGPSTCQPPFVVNYANLTSGPGTLTYNWDLGNTTTSTQASPSGTYAAAGSYPVSLTATSSFGCSNTVQKTIPINGFNTSFQTIGNKDSVCLGSSIGFQNTASPAPTSVVWDFGDGTTFTGLVPPAKTYAAAGSYTVTMNATYPNCSSSATKTVKVFGLPTVDFSAPKTNTCKAPLAVAFQNLSPDAVGSSWTFGDGGTSTATNPTYTYNNTGNFDVTLAITDSKGCQNTVTKTQFVNIAPPALTILNTPGGVCLGKPYTATAGIGSPDGISSVTWDFGDGSPVTSSPTHTYAAAGSYPLTLNVVTNDGCTATTTVGNAVQVGTPPMVNFSKDLTTVCHGSVVTFTNLSTPVNSPANPVVWTFGDGKTSTLQNPGHKFPDSGFFTIKLKVTNNGCADSLTKANFVHVLPPIANFRDMVLDCTVRNNISFYDSTKNDPFYGPLVYDWRFGDPGAHTSTAANPSFAYPAVSSFMSYNVKLIVKNNVCQDTIIKTVKLYNETATFLVPKTVFCRNEVATFSCTNNYSYIKSFNWVVDGVSFVTNQGGHQVKFATDGNHTIQLITTDINGCTSASSVTNFSVIGPKALFTIANNGGCSNKAIVFNNASTSSGTIVKWVFDFGDGSTQSFTAPPFTHTYAATGNYTVSLTVYDNTSSGCSDTYTLTGTAGAVITKPVSKFVTAATVYCPGTPLQFTDSSSGGGLSYLWSFGDGTNATTKNPLHAYPVADKVYDVKLVVTDSVGCSDSLTKTAFVKITIPKPGYTVTDTVTLCPPLETKFVFTGRDYDSFSWDFGDSTTSTLANTSHFYNAYGKYTAKIFAYGIGGCVDSLSIPINVLDPQANTSYTFSPTTACNELTVNFAVKTPAGTTFTFNFGDGTGTPSSNVQDTAFSHFYSLPNTYRPSILLKDNTGCQVGIGGRGTVNILGGVPLFGLDKDKFCDSGAVYFTDYSQQANDPIVTKTWDFGDGTAPAVFPNDALHTYATPGLYVPALTVTTMAGCSKTFTDTVRVLATPSPVISSIDGVCYGLPINFTGSLRIPPDTAIKWLWALGEGKTSTQQNPSVLYADTGLHHITLKATNSLGCQRDTAKDIVVYPLPSITVTGDTTIIAGSPGLIVPLAYSSNASAFNWLPSPTLSCTNCANPFASPKYTTTYKVSVTDDNGCISSRNLTILVVCNNKNFFIPNTFSPNNDGANDKFYPRGTGLNTIQALRIFNRWGEMVFEKRYFPANDATAGWDGTYKGKPASTDTYIYMIDIICENASIITYKGNVTLIR